MYIVGLLLLNQLDATDHLSIVDIVYNCALNVLPMLASTQEGVD